MTAFNQTLTCHPPPWRLFGKAFVCCGLFDSTAIRPLIPKDLRIVNVLPNRTLGSILIAHYNEQSTYSYHEVIVAPALVAHKKNKGFYISHICVDHQDALVGGHSIWGLEKFTAQFSWDEHDNISVSSEQYGKFLDAQFSPKISLLPRLRPACSLAIISSLNKQWMSSNVKSKANYRLAKTHSLALSLPGLTLPKHLFTLNFDVLALEIATPRIITNAPASEG
ncbi:MAG: hypothetical protein Tsb005_15970 [Gammaproteobacteria bacterium]